MTVDRKSIRVFKLISGEAIIAILDHYNCIGGDYVISFPYQDMDHLGFVPWFAVAETRECIQIRASHIIRVDYPAAHYSDKIDQYVEVVTDQMAQEPADQAVS